MQEIIKAESIYPVKEEFTNGVYPVRKNFSNRAYPEDIILIDRFLQGEVYAFDQIVLKYKDKVFNLCYRYLGSFEEANDTSQEVFLKLYKSLKNFRREASFYSYLFRMVVNFCKNRLKKLRRRRFWEAVSLDDPIKTEQGSLDKFVIDTSPTPSEVLDKKSQEEILQSAIDTLEPTFREVLVMRDIEGVSYEEITRILNTNIGTVKSRLHRARMMLKEKVKGVI